MHRNSKPRLKFFSNIAPKVEGKLTPDAGVGALLEGGVEVLGAVAAAVRVRLASELVSKWLVKGTMMSMMVLLREELYNIK